MHLNSLFISSSIFCFLLVFFLEYLYINFARSRNIADSPNERTLHKGVIPRGGGVVFVIVVCAAILTWITLTDQLELIVFLASLFSISLIGFLEDVVGLRALVRFLLQISVSCLFVTFSLAPDNILVLVLMTLFLVWSTNLYNFMDGSNGLATSQGIIILSFVALGASFYSSDTTLFLSMISLASLAGFLVWNFPNPKVFMGDSGSYFLGFLVGALVLLGLQFDKSEVPWIFAFAPYFMFFSDSTITLIRRVIGGEPWYRPHNSHLYQRLIKGGSFTHAKVFLLYGSCSILIGLCSVFLFKLDMLMLAILFFGFLFFLRAALEIKFVRSVKNNT